MTKNNGGSRKSIKQGKGYLRGDDEMEALASGRGKAGSGYALKKIAQIQEARREAAEAFREAAMGRPRAVEKLEAKTNSPKETDVLKEYQRAAEAKRARTVAANALFEQHGKLATGFYTSGATIAVSSLLFDASIPPETDPAKRNKPAALLAVRGAVVESPYSRSTYEWDLSRYRGYTDKNGNLERGDVKTIKVTGTVAQVATFLREWEKTAKQGGSCGQTQPGGDTAVHHSRIDPYRLPGTITHTLSEARLALGLDF